MPQQPIPFVPNQQSGLEPMAGAMPVAINVVMEADGSLRRRPGIATYSTTTVDADGIAGVYATVDGRIYAAGDTDNARTLYRLVNGVSSTLSSAATSFLNGALRPQFTETESIVAIAGGRDIQQILLADDVSTRLSSEAPQSSHVVANGARLVANDVTVDKSYVSYSSLGAGSAVTPFTEWLTSNARSSGYIIATARPDLVVALTDNASELFAFGNTSLQIYGADQSRDYVSIAVREFGCIAPYSVVKMDSKVLWLDHLRRVILTDGREYKVVSGQIKATLDAMATVSDCFAYRVCLGGIDVACFCFPTDGRTFVYQEDGGWSVWMGWNNATANYQRLGINAVCADPATGKVLAGMTSGKVGLMSRTALTDLGDPIVASVTTGYQSRGTDARKHCKTVRLAFRRGETVLTGEPMAQLSWRDDGGPWGAPYRVGLGVSGDYDPVVELRSLGVYRRREWNLEFSGAEDVVLVSATEDFEVLE